jgi:hypothetical protein
VTVLDAEYLPVHLKLIPIFSTFLGAGFMFYIYYVLTNFNNYKIILDLKGYYDFLIRK